MLAEAPAIRLAGHFPLGKKQLQPTELPVAIAVVHHLQAVLRPHPVAVILAKPGQERRGRRAAPCDGVSHRKGQAAETYVNS